jgi:hypothetical protein
MCSARLLTPATRWGDVVAWLWDVSPNDAIMLLAELLMPQRGNRATNARPSERSAPWAPGDDATFLCEG